MNFIDFHADTLLKLELLGCPVRNLQNESLAITPEKLGVFGSTAVIFSIWSGPHFPGKLSFEDTVSRLQSGRQSLVQAGYHLAPHSRADLQSLWDKRKPIAFFGIEGGFALNADKNAIKLFRSLGVVRYTITHFESPGWANSDSSQTQDGLSEVGIEIIKEMNASGIIPDVAHANEATMLDVIATSSKPVIYSHGGVQHLSKSARGVSDRAMEGIANSGGVIGLSLFPHHHTQEIEYRTGVLDQFFEDYSILKKISSQDFNDARAAEVKLLLSSYPRPKAMPSMEFFRRSLDYAIDKVGVEAVAIGTDFDGSPFYFEGISDCKDLCFFADLLNTSGISATTIDKLFWENAKRVLWDNVNE